VQAARQRPIRKVVNTMLDKWSPSTCPQQWLRQVIDKTAGVVAQSVRRGNVIDQIPAALLICSFMSSKGMSLLAVVLRRPAHTYLRAGRQGLKPMATISFDLHISFIDATLGTA